MASPLVQPLADSGDVQQFGTQFSEAIAFLVGVMGASVRVNCQGVTREVHSDLVRLFEPARVKVRHRADIITGHNGVKLIVDVLWFEPFIGHDRALADEQTFTGTLKAPSKDGAK